jgi:YesN/AraC family two-component response regulator
MVRQIQVLIVDDQPRARQGMRALIATCPEVESIQEAANGREAILRIEESRPDVVLMDVLMPEMDGLEATRLIKARWDEIKIIVLSMYDEYANEAKAAGADAFITKGEPAERLLAVLSGMTSKDGARTNQGE